MYVVYRNSTIALYKCITAVRKPLELGGVEGRQKAPLCCFEWWWSVALIQQLHISDEGNQSSAAFKAKLWRTFTSQYRSLVHAKSSVFTTVYKKFVVELDTRDTRRQTTQYFHITLGSYSKKSFILIEKKTRIQTSSGQAQSICLFQFGSKCPSWGILLCIISENYKFCSLKCKSTIDLCILNLESIILKFSFSPAVVTQIQPELAP